MISSIAGVSGSKGIPFDNKTYESKSSNSLMDEKKANDGVDRLTTIVVEKKDNKQDLESESKNTPDYKEIVAKLKNFLDEYNQTIEFTLDKETNKMIMRVIDNITKEVIQQFPPEVTLKIARIVASTMETGTVTNAKV